MYYYKNDHCNDTIFWLFYSEKCAKVQSHIARPKTSHTHAHRTHSFKPVPHALPHAHCTCVSAIIRTCVPQPNICLLRGSCTNKSQFFFYIYSMIYTVDFLFCWFYKPILFWSHCFWLISVFDLIAVFDFDHIVFDNGSFEWWTVQSNNIMGFKMPMAKIGSWGWHKLLNQKQCD